jgi:hypothetical protein
VVVGLEKAVEVAALAVVATVLATVVDVIYML